MVPIASFGIIDLTVANDQIPKAIRLNAVGDDALGKIESLTIEVSYPITTSLSTAMLQKQLWSSDQRNS